jgi:hypothetical protein
MACSICGLACDRTPTTIAAFGCHGLTWCCVAFGAVGLAPPLRTDAVASGIRVTSLACHRAPSGRWASPAGRQTGAGGGHRPPARGGPRKRDALLDQAKKL